MALRRGKKGSKTGPAAEVDTDSAASDDESDRTASGDAVGADSGGATDATRAVPPAGDRRPLDDEEAGGDATMPRLDLGCLRVPVLPGTEVRVEMNEAQQPIAATVVHGTSSLQVLAFAAPRHSGIWDEVRTEIAESVRTDGGKVDEVKTDFGIELHARVRGEVDTGTGDRTAAALRWLRRTTLVLARRFQRPCRDPFVTGTGARNRADQHGGGSRH